jgi:hypothetical protein
MNICIKDLYLIFFTIIIFYLIYCSVCNKNKEGFDATSDMKAVINQVYNADIEAIRNLSSIATQLTTGGLTIPGTLNVSGITKVNSLYTGGGTNNNPGGKDAPWETHFPYRGDGNNYIRGDTIIDGNVTIPNNKLNKKENRARYIRIGNKEVPELRQDYWTLIEAKVYNSDGINIALKKPVAILEGTAYDNNASPPGNITNNIIFPNNVQSDNWNLGYHGNPGVNVIQIDLGANNYISQIELYNRWSADVDWRMNGTTIELYDESGVRNKIIYTGLWHRQYSKTYLL